MAAQPTESTYTKEEKQAIHKAATQRMSPDMVNAMVTGDGDKALAAAREYQKKKSEIEEEFKAGRWSPTSKWAARDSNIVDADGEPDSIFAQTSRFLGRMEAAARIAAFEAVQPISKAAAKRLVLCKDGKALLNEGGDDAALSIVAKKLGVDAARNDKDLCEVQLDAAVAIYAEAADCLDDTNDIIGSNACDARAALYRTVALLLAEPVVAPVMSVPEQNAVKALMLDTHHWARQAMQKSFDVQGILLMGYMKKRGPRFNFGWDDRFCVLRRRKLETYTEGSLYELKETIDLEDDCRAVAFKQSGAPGEAVKYKLTVPDGFVLDPGPGYKKDRQMYYFDTGNPDKLQSWLDAIDEDARSRPDESQWAIWQSASNLVTGTFGRIDQANSGRKLLDEGGPPCGQVLLAKKAACRAAALDALILNEFRCCIELFQESAMQLPSAARLDQNVEGIEWNLQSFAARKAELARKAEEEELAKAELVNRTKKKADLARSAGSTKSKVSTASKKAPAKIPQVSKAKKKLEPPTKEPAAKEQPANASFGAGSATGMEHIAVEYASHASSMSKAAALLGGVPCEGPQMTPVEEDALAIMTNAMALAGAEMPEGPRHSSITMSV